MYKEVKFIVDKDGYADLYFDGLHVGHVGRCSGMDETLRAFNKYMEKEGQVYRLSAKYQDMILYGDSDVPLPATKKYRSIDDT